MKKIFLISSLSLFIFSGCAQDRYGNSNNEGVGTVVGALGGALVGTSIGVSTGAKVVGGLIGASIGGLIGNRIGERLDSRSRQRMEYASYNGLKYGKEYSWKTETADGYFRPTKSYSDRHGKYCREFTQSVRISGKITTAYGKACQQRNGDWEIVSNY